MKRVAIISKPVSPPFRDGTMVLIRNLVENSPSCRFYVNAYLGSTYTLRNTRMIRLFSKGGGYSSSMLQYLSNLLTLTLPFRKDIIHAIFTPTRLTSSVLSNIIRLKSEKAIATITSSPSSEIARLNLKSFELLVTLSEWTRKRFIDAGYNNILKIYPGIDIPDDFDPEVGKKEFPTFVYAGELSDEMAVHTVLKAVETLGKRGPKFRVIFACRSKKRKGGGMEVERFLSLVEEMGVGRYIEYIGETDDILSHLRESRALLLPLSTMKGKMDIPIIMLETMARGRPVIASKLPQLIEALDEGGGWNIDIDDGEDISDIMAELIESPFLSVEKGEEARKAVKERFSVERMVSSYKTIYDEL